MSLLPALLAQAEAAPSRLSPMIITWIGLGLLLGFVCNNFFSRDEKPTPVGILVGLLGTIAGGTVFYLMSRGSLVVVNIGVAAAVGVALMFIFHKFVRPA